MRRQLYFENAYNPDPSADDEDIEYEAATIYVDKDTEEVVFVSNAGEIRFSFDEWAHIEAFVKSERRAELD